MATRSGIILGELRTQFGRLHPHHRVKLRIVGCRPAVDLDADYGFLELSGLAIQAVFDHVAQEPGQRLRPGKAGTGGDQVDLPQCRTERN